MADRLRRLWDFDDLDSTKLRFQDQLARESAAGGRAEVLTQLARLEGLREHFAHGELLLRQAEELAASNPAARIRIQLERGRLRRSSGDVAGGLPFFESAFSLARVAGEEVLAADAAHMAALAAGDRAGFEAWTRRGIEIGEAATDPEVVYWLGPLLNNLGWEYQDAGEHEAALDAFQRALQARLRFPEQEAAIRFAKEAVAQALRSLGRSQEAAALLQEPA